MRIRISPETVLLALLGVAVLWKGGKALDLVWLLALTGGFLTLWTSGRGEKSVPLSPVLLVSMLALVLWTAASFVLSSTRNYGFDEVLQTTTLILLMIFAAPQTKEHPAFPARFARVLSVSALVASSVGLIVYVLQPVSRFSGTFFDYRFHTDYWPNAWADFVLLAWPVLLWTLFLRRSRRMPEAFDRDWIKAAVLGIFLATLFLSYSRAGFIAFMGQIVLLGLALSRIGIDRFPVKRSLRILGVSALTSLVVFAGANQMRSQFHGVESALKKATFSSAEGASSISERISFWKQASTLAFERPLLGWGPYSFRFVQPHLQSEILATSDHAHNVILKYASERGIPGALLLLLIIVLAVRPSVTSLRPGRAKDALPIAAFFLISVAGVLAHNLVDYNLQFVGIALPLWLMLGMLACTDSPGLRPGRTVAVIAAFLLFLSLYEGTNLFLSSRARHAEARGESEEALEWYSWTGVSFFPRDARLSQGAILLGLNRLPQAEDAVSKSLVDNPEDARAWRLLGDIYLQWNKRFDALRAYEKAFRYGKFNDAGILRGLVYLQEDIDRDSLVERRPEFDRLLNDYGLAIRQNTHFIALSSSVEDAVSLCDLMAQYFPEDAESYRQLARRAAIHAKEERSKTASRPRGILW